VQEAYEANSSPFSCDEQWSHPLHCLRVERECNACLQKTIKTKGKLEKMRELIGEVTERMDKLRSEKEVKIRDRNGEVGDVKRVLDDLEMKLKKLCRESREDRWSVDLMG
jgi:chromosome segregation ATPase